MNKNANTTKSVKKSTKSNKTKKVVAKIEAAPVAETVAENKATAIQIEITPAPVVVNQVKRGKGRPFGSSSLSLVNLQDLVNALPANIQIPLSNRVLRSMNGLGLKISSVPFKASTGFSEIAKTFKPSVATTVIDLNKETVEA